MESKINKTIDISVIIPVYNREKTIVNCVNSILNQTYLPKEIIIVDDGSTDNTIISIEGIENSIINLIALNKNKGAQHARNIGVKNSKSEWIAFLDSDDTWINNKLERQIEIIEANGRKPFIVINSNCYRHHEKSNLKEIWKLNSNIGNTTSFYNDLLINPGPMFQGMLTSKIALEKIGYLDDSIVSYQEWDTSISLAKFCDYHWIEIPLFTYFIPKKETSFRKKDIWIPGYLSVIKKNKTDIIIIHGKAIFSNLIYNGIKQVGEWKYWDFYKKLKKQFKNELNLYQLFKLEMYNFLKLKPSIISSLKNYFKNPINSTKHFIKSIFIK